MGLCLEKKTYRRGIIMGKSNETGRDQFRTKVGFIIACVGSAVGMANIWMFPYRTGAFGGAAFLDRKSVV